MAEIDEAVAMLSDELGVPIGISEQQLVGATLGDVTLAARVMREMADEVARLRSENQRLTEEITWLRGRRWLSWG